MYCPFLSALSLQDRRTERKYKPGAAAPGFSLKLLKSRAKSATRPFRDTLAPRTLLRSGRFLGFGLLLHHDASFCRKARVVSCCGSPNTASVGPCSARLPSANTCTVLAIAF